MPQVVCDLLSEPPVICAGRGGAVRFGPLPSRPSVIEPIEGTLVSRVLLSYDGAWLGAYPHFKHIMQ